MELSRHGYGGQAPADAPTTSYWAHWQHCSACWGWDFPWEVIHHGTCEVGGSLALRDFPHLRREKESATQAEP